MKKRLFIFASFLMATTTLYFTSCDSGSGDSGLTQLDPEDAKVEVRAASQDITNSLNTLMEHEGAAATTMFMDLSAIDADDWKTTVAQSLKGINPYKVEPYKTIISENFSLKNATSDPDPNVGGIYEYDFYYDDFVHVGNASYLQFLYPADWDAYSLEDLNAVLTISDYESVMIEYEETPTKFKVELEVDNDFVMSFNYQGSYDSDGMPTSMSMTLNMPPYTLSMSQSYTANSHTSTFSFKEGNQTLIGYNITATLDANDEVTTISGHYQVTPLKAVGNANVLAIEECYSDITCMNSNINITLEHTELNAIIGKLEFREVFDPYWEEYYPELVIVYSDDTYDVFAEIFDIE